MLYTIVLVTFIGSFSSKIENHTKTFHVIEFSGISHTVVTITYITKVKAK